jgi:hypothetical protein
VFMWLTFEPGTRSSRSGGFVTVVMLQRRLLLQKLQRRWRKRRLSESKGAEPCVRSEGWTCADQGPR